MPSSAFRWWRAALAVASGVTMPRADVAESDRIVERQLKQSALAVAGRRAAAPIRAAAHTSLVVSRVRHASAWWLSVPLAARVSAIGYVMITAGATVLVLEAAKPAPAAPLFWILPVLACTLGVLVALASGAFARALAGRSA